MLAVIDNDQKYIMYTPFSITILVDFLYHDHYIYYTEIQLQHNRTNEAYVSITLNVVDYT